MSGTTKRTRLWLVGILIATFASTAPAASAATWKQRFKTEQRKVTVLKRENVNFRKSLNKMSREIDRLDVELEDAIAAQGPLLTKISDLERFNEASKAANLQLADDNRKLREGLPAAIEAVPIEDFPTLIFGPARARWRCDSFYTSQGYYSYTFDSPNFC